MNLFKFAKHQLDRVAAWVAIAVGLVLLFAGWFGASGAATAVGAIPYLLSGGIGGLFLLGFGATLWLSADMRDEWRKLDRLERIMTGDARLHGPAEPASTGDQNGAASGPLAGTAGPDRTKRDRVGAAEAGRHG